MRRKIDAELTLSAAQGYLRMAVTLQEAITAAKQSCMGDEWLSMSPAEQTRLIYREMRRLDLENVTAQQAEIAALRADQPNDSTNTGMLQSAETQCCAPVRTRASGRCAWKATTQVNGVPYCGFHARLYEMAGRPRLIAVAD